MPRLSDSMEEGTIIKWLKQAGDEVKRGDALADIETDKATMTYESDAAGFLQIVAGEGDTLAIGSTIARLLPDAAAAAAAPAAAGPVAATNGGTAAEAPSEAPTPVAAAAAAPAPAAVAGEAAAPVPAAASAGGRIKASPIARRMAAERGVDLATLAGSGPDGRIVKADVIAAADGAPAAGAAGAAGAAPAAGVAVAAAVPGEALGAKGEVEVIELTRTQQLIARRMASAKATIPEFTVTVEVDAEPSFELRAQLHEVASPLPSLNDIVVKACALALRAHPTVNAAYVDGHFERYERVNIGVAVASEGTLVVPTVFDADKKSLVTIAAQTRELVAKVRDATIGPAELAGGTFTVSNLGMFGVARFTAVINAPQAAILAVGAASPRPTALAGGRIAVRRIMELTISADHRIIYGADAAAFLATVREHLERPAGLLL
jgi:pyruvate dehydrogenase E2 component (dihydrolipoamide acetyltransferase)